MGLKISLGIATGSLSLKADALHSVTDSANNILGLITNRFSSPKPDREHPYGHQKFEAVGALGIAAFLGIACFEILQVAVEKIFFEIMTQCDTVYINTNEHYRANIETETREIYLTRSGKIKSLVIPPGLPEWIVDPDRNSLSVVGGSLLLKQSATVPDATGGLCIPMFFDLDARRSRGRRTWRKLTVAESLEIVPETTAAAFRVQVGRFSYVFYRSLTPPANRTFLGENFSGEFFAGRLEKNGEMTPLLNIESAK